MRGEWLRGVVLAVGGAVLVAGACRRAPLRSLPNAPADEAIVLAASDATHSGGVALWQGFSHVWGYNHRVNRLGSIVEQSEGGCPLTDDADALCAVKWMNTGASGTGPDAATVRTYVALVAAGGVGFAAASQEIVLSGREGEDLTGEAIVELALDPFTAARSQHVAVLNGFDLLALDSADKLIRFGLAVGDVVVEGDVARVPVRATGAFACSSAECPARNVVDYSVKVAVVVAGFEPTDLTVGARTLDLSYAWDEREELDPAVATVPLDLDGRGARVAAFRSFAVELDREHHTLAMGLDLADATGVLQFENWRRLMRRKRPPGSFTAFREAGTAAWTAELAVLDLADATVLPLVDENRIKWAGFGRDANSPEAEAPGGVVYAQRQDPGMGLADHPIELAGTRLEGVRGRRAEFRPRRSWARSGRRQRDVLEAFCTDDGPPDLTDDAVLGGSIAQLVELAQMLDTLGPAAVAAPPFVPEGEVPPAKDAPRVVRGGDLVSDGETGGGVLYLKPTRAGWDVFGEEWWRRVGDVGIELRGRVGVADDGAVQLVGRAVWVDAPRTHAAVRGRVELTGPPDARVLASTVAVPCEGELELRATLRPSGDCATWDGAVRSVTIGSRRHRRTLEVDDRCDGCASPGVACTP